MIENKGNSSSFHLSFCVTTIMSLTILIVATGVFFLSSLILLNQNQAAMAQQQPQELPLVSKDISFDIDNVTV
jgi:hypothetical protein